MTSTTIKFQTKNGEVIPSPQTFTNGAALTENGAAPAERQSSNVPLLDVLPSKKTSKSSQNLGSVLRNNLLLVSTLASVFVAAVVGVAIVCFPPRLIHYNETNDCNETKEVVTIFTPRQLSYIFLPGEMFLRSIQMMILPLVTTAIISGFASFDAVSSRKMAAATFGFYSGNTLLAAVESIIGIMAVKHLMGGGADKNCSQEEMARGGDKMIDLVKNMVPANLVTAAFQQVSSKPVAWHFVEDGVQKSIMIVEDDSKEGANILGLVVFAAVVGLICSSFSKETKAFSDFFVSFNFVIMKILHLIMCFTPVAVFFLVFGEIVKRSLEDLEEMAKMIGGFVLLVLVVTAIHSFIALPLIYAVVLRRNPYKYQFAVAEALMGAFATASSSAVLPITIKRVQKKGVDKRVAEFVLPIGSNINTSGACIYYTIGAIFCAKLEGLDPSFVQVVTIAVFASLICIGNSGTSNSGTVYFIMILSAAGLPTTYVGIVYAIDWFMDRFITTSDVNGDIFVVAFVNHFCGNILPTLL